MSQCKEPVDRHAQPKLMFATDVAFWNRKTGAQQRIAALVDYFVQLNWPVAVVFIGSIRDTGTDSAAIVRDLADHGGLRIQKEWSPNAVNRLQIVSLVDDWQPIGWLDKATWRFKCIAHWFRSQVFDHQSAKLPDSKFKRLADFFSPEFKHRFREFVSRVRPQIVIVEYLTLGYLVPPRGQRAGIEYWVDTHDLLSTRCRQFRELGLQHWIEINETEEKEALAVFDTIIAIQEKERTAIQNMLEQSRTVVVAGFATTNHADFNLTGESRTAIPNSKESDSRPDTERPLSVGLIASNNGVNAAGLNWFLKSVWPVVLQSNADVEITLNLAGSICDSLDPKSLPSKVKQLGMLDRLSSFYDQIQIVINPIQLGTGLKIKSIEALIHGKPLISTCHGVEGLIQVEGDFKPWIATDSSTEMANAIIELAKDSCRRSDLSAAAVEYTNQFLAPELVYRELVRSLQEAASAS